MMVQALDLTISGGYGNFLFDSSRITSLQSENKAFSEQSFILASLGAQETVAETTKITILYERDPILRNILYTSLFYDLGFATVQVGPYFGLFNTANLQITPGLSMALQIGIPGLVFGTFRSDTTLGTGLQVPGDYVQQKSELGLWIWGTQILTKFIIQSRSFSEQKNCVPYHKRRTNPLHPCGRHIQEECSVSGNHYHWIPDHESILHYYCDHRHRYDWGYHPRPGWFGKNQQSASPSWGL